MQALYYPSFTARLICVFVFACPDYWFSAAADQIMRTAAAFHVLDLRTSFHDLHKSRDARKPVSRVSDQVLHKPVRVQPQEMARSIGNFGFRKKRNCAIQIAKTMKALICAFVIA